MTCGTGFRTRKVNCEIFLQVSRTTAVLPDLECAGSKPASRETCRRPDCGAEGLSLDGSSSSEISNKIDRLTSGVHADDLPLTEDGDEDEESDGEDGKTGRVAKVQYTWRSDEMTVCSAPCLGGRVHCLLSRHVYGVDCLSLLFF